MPKSFSETWYLCKEQLLTLVTVGLYLNWSKYVTTRQDWSSVDYGNPKLAQRAQKGAFKMLNTIRKNLGSQNLEEDKPEL